MLFELLETNEPDNKARAAALAQKYGLITLDVDQNPIDVSYFSNSSWHEFQLGKRRWRINNIEVTETEWQIVYCCFCPQYKPVWTDELTKWDFIDLDEAVERILDRVQTESAPSCPNN